jgi:hypothetical protein
MDKDKDKDTGSHELVASDVLPDVVTCNKVGLEVVGFGRLTVNHIVTRRDWHVARGFLSVHVVHVCWDGRRTTPPLCKVRREQTVVPDAAKPSQATCMAEKTHAITSSKRHGKTRTAPKRRHDRK